MNEKDEITEVRTHLKMQGFWMILGWIILIFGSWFYLYLLWLYPVKIIVVSLSLIVLNFIFNKLKKKTREIFKEE